ncbi:NAD(+) diphosphatase [Novosphingobium sp. Gsoil 351]|uniref:NAD(+) diphosphatase n=1 Tax=Novosphingobium sp. Gsoil 351 TaxID=2675225 RepID=UPI001E504BE0|nr:NAD(+) diphosphatase [Novosphingobium sp. Gsoil 351]
MSGTIAFAGAQLDRADAIRNDPEQLSGLMDWRARLLKLDGLSPAITPDNTLEWGTLADADPASELIFLGLLGGKGCFAEVHPKLAGNAAPLDPVLWRALTSLEHEDLAIYGAARSLVDWHARHRFCARCGQPTALTKGGWQRRCASCGAEHFPRTDPVTIMLVEHEDRVLLGRQPRFPPRMFSALAGFVEPGESIEEAVAREVFEEAGVRVREVRYIASQPWPFPSQLMIGCTCVTDDPTLTIDANEIEEARWFTRDELNAARAAGIEGTADLLFPRSFAIAHHLVTWWLDR